MKTRRSVPERLVASLLAVVSAGCYAYVPMEEGRPSPGDDVRVVLAGEGSGEATGGTSEAAAGERLQGLVVESRPDSLRLSVRLQPALAGAFERDRREVVSLAYEEIRRIERPELNALRTGAMVVGGLGLLAGFMAIVLGGDDAGTPGDDGGGGPSLEIGIP